MLKINNLHASIEEKPILKGVSLEVKPGEIHAIMGPNGGGKSTLAYTLMGHPAYEVKTDKSKVKIDGVDILDKSPDERSRLGLFLAFQYPTSISGVSVQNFLRAASEAHKQVDSGQPIGNSEKTGKKQSVLEFRKDLEKKSQELGVNPELLKRSLNEGFSGGEKKRVEILQMAVLQPKYAILDETDSGLDVDAIKAVSQGVKHIVKEYNTGVIVITHYQRILKYLEPDFVHVIVGGKIVESGGRDFAEKLEMEGYKQWQDLHPSNQIK